MLLLDRFVERRYCLTDEGCPRFNRMEDAIEPWIVLVLEITLPLEAHVNLSVNAHQLSEHFRILCVMDFEILESEKLLLILSLIFKPLNKLGLKYKD